MSDNESIGNFGMGFLIGAVIGVAVGLLYAPKPGRETREMLREKAEGAMERAEDAVEKVKEAAAEAKKRVGDKFGRSESAG